jgi:hypothetical protein
VGNTKIENQYIFPGTESDEIDNSIENDLNIREGNEKTYLYPQYLYELLLQKPNINIEFRKPNNMGIKEYNNEWTRAFHTLFLQIVTELGEDCYPKLCLNMTAGKNLAYKCMNHGKLDLNCCAIDCLHTLDTTMVFLTNSAYFSNREHIRDHCALVFPKMMRYLYRILAHIYFHRKLFDSLQHRFRIVERLTLYCKKFKAIDNPQEYCIKL